MDEDEVSGWEQVGLGQRALTWELWSAPIGQSTVLTDTGRRVMQEVVETIAEFLGARWLDTFLRPRASTGTDDHLPLMSLRWWPGNDTRQVYTRLLAFAAHIRLFAEAPGIAQVRRDMRTDIGKFAHAHLQLEVGALALRDGWQVRFEPKVTSRQQGRADLELTRPEGAMLVETKGFRLDDQSRDDLRFADRITATVLALELSEHVNFDGDLGVGDDLAELEDWLAGLSAAARQVRASGVPAEVIAPFGGALLIRRGPPTDGSGYTVPIRRGDEWRRLRGVIRAKAEQGRSDLPLWLRLDQTSEFWNLSAPAGAAHVDWLVNLARQIQQELAEFDNVAGVVLSRLPAASVAADAELGLLGSRAALLGRRTGLALWREALIIPAAHRASAEQMQHWLHWYRAEGSWPTWALQQLDLPPAEELFGDDPATPAGDG